jgi:hypothetical protein
MLEATESTGSLATFWQGVQERRTVLIYVFLNSPCHPPIKISAVEKGK